MNLQDLSTQLLFTTVPIWAESQGGKVSAGTAFFYNVPIPDQPGQSIPLLVTNDHVVAEAKRAVIELIERQGEEPLPDRRVRVEIDADALARHRRQALDLAAIPLGPVLNQLQTSNRPIFFRSVGPELVPAESVIKDLAALEDVVFVGYPAGLRDETHANPLIRRGITSTPVWRDFQGSPCFLIDAGVFPGSSGSPVFILNQGAYQTRTALVVGSRLLFLGVITQTILGNQEGGKFFLGLGKVVRSSEVKAFVDDVVRTVQGSSGR